MKLSIKLTWAVLVILVCAPAYANHDSKGHNMTVHHMHMLINHAVEMAAEGSNLVMIGQMGMAGDIDRMNISHGDKMISHARALIKQIMQGKEMQSLHNEGATAETSEAMAYTHKLAKSAMSYIEALSSMSGAPGHNH